MKIVVDTSIIISVLTNEKHKQDIIKNTKYADLIAPFSLHWEIGNAFSSMFKRNIINLKQAKEVLFNYYQIPIRFIDVDLESSIEISKQFNIYAYDAYFLVCSQTEKAPLMTLDKNLLKLSKEIGIITLEVNHG